MESSQVDVASSSPVSRTIFNNLAAANFPRTSLNGITEDDTPATGLIPYDLLV